LRKLDLSNIKATYELTVAKRFQSKNLLNTTISSQNNDIFMGPLSKTLNVTLSSSTKKATEKTKETHSIRCRVYKEETLIQLVNYFYNYPLFSSKSLNFKDWASVIHKKRQIKRLELRLFDFHSEFKEIKNQMNRKRTQFDWNHLNYFYYLPNNFSNPKK
jgi:hypothetical protein